MRLFTLLMFVLLQACTTPQSLRLYQGPAIGESQESSFVLPVEFEIISLDNESVAQFQQTFRTHPLTVKLAPGHHTLVLRYSDVWQIDSDNHDKLISGLLTFDGEFHSGTRYQLRTPDLNTYAQAQEFILSPSAELASSNHSIDASYTEKSDALTFSKDETVNQVDYPNLKQLQFWWANANQYERQQFLQWTQSKQ